MAKKLTYEFVKGEFEKERYQLLSKEYKTSKQQLDYICPKGHRHHISWNRWNAKRRCWYCYIQSTRFDIELIRSMFEKENYTLLTTVYKNCYEKLDYICPKGHRYAISFTSWQSGNRCVLCDKENRKCNILKFIRAEFEKENYILLTKEYRHSHQQLQYTCNNGHEHSMVFGSWRWGHRCPTCFKENISGSNNPSWKGGISCEPYCEVWVKKEFKKMIKERDDYQCQNPDCWGKDGKAGVLTIHHIDYDKKNCNSDNLITLCRSCNVRANKDREWHTAFYSNLLGRGNGK